MIGQTLGPYQVLGKLGEGGMGEVYRARDTRLGRDVAIKILPAAFTSDPDRLARFEREARVLASLNHPNIAQIYGTEAADGVRALVMELVDGETLAEKLTSGFRRQGSGLPLGEALAIAKQIAGALDAAHEKGIVHRDLKPANIKIASDGTVKVLDFGLAKAQATTTDDDAATMTIGDTREGVVVGTAAYMSPEQARGVAVDKRTDIWAFGCVLYEMLTGRAPFRGGTVSDIIVAILEREPDWSVLPPKLTASANRVLRRCLEKDSKRRIRDIADVRLELEESAIDLAPPHAERRVQRWPLYLAGAAIAALVAAAAGLALRPRPEPEWTNPLANATFTRYTDFEGAELDAAISPDGQFIVFLSNRTGPYEAWLSQVGSGEFVNVSKGRIPVLLNDEVRNIGFSSDGQIWFRGDRTDQTGERVSAGTQVQSVIGGDLRPLLDTGIEPVWSPDGSRLLYHDPAPGDPIFIADRNGRNPRRIYAAQPGHHCHYLVWSPDAAFVYFVGGIPPEELDVWRVPASGGEAERLTSHNGSVAYPTFLDDETLLYRATAADGSGPWLYALDVTTKISRRISLGVEQYLSIAAASDGRRLVASVSNPAGGIWSVPIGERLVGESEARPVTVPTVTARSPRAGLGYLLYLSFKEGARGLWRVSDGKANELWRPVDGGLQMPPAISADGTRLALTVRRDGVGRLYLMRADGTDVRPLAPALEVRDPPSWAPDGQWLAVAVGNGLMKVPVDGGEPTRLVQGLVRLPVWSPDGRFVLYSEALQGPGYTVKAVAPDGSPVSIPPLWVRRGGDRYRMLPDGRRVVYVAGDYGRQDFWLLDLATSERRQLTSLQPGTSIRGFDISEDGRQVIFDRVRENSDVVLIERPMADPP